MHKLLPLACLLGAAGAHAQGVPPDANGALAPSAADAKVVPSVTIAGSRANDTQTRQQSTAAKMVFGREELDRNGDSSVGEILKRLPGITLGGPPGRGGGGGVRMRGLGNGYTQMLVNGERPPAGFSLESLPPDQVERIEVMRGPVAEHSTQAIAGTINIVLREGYQQKDVQLRVADNLEQGRHSPELSLTSPFKIGAVSVMLNAGASHNRNADQSDTYSDEVLLDGTLVRQQRIASTTERDNKSLRLAPRFSYRFANGDTLNFQQFVVSNRGAGRTDNRLTQTVGAAPYAISQGYATSENTFFRGFGNWLHRMEGGARIDVKFGFGGGNSRNESERNQYDQAYALRDRFDDRSFAKQRGVSTGGKYTTPMGKGHLLALGWDLESQTREQTSVSLRNGATRFAGSGDNLDADTHRVALFAQDEWDITPQWSVYLGLRWEGIRTNSDNRGFKVKSTTSVWSPVLHGVWRIPGSEKDQVRASLTQSYRAPQLNDLIAAPSFSSVADDPNNPDRTGNPNLKPELARGIDLAYEHYLGKSGILSASAFIRKIDDLMRRDLRQYRLGDEIRWLSTPSNIGSADTRGIELEAKFQLAELYPDAPNVDLRANYSRFWSDVDGIPGPDNRLDGQASQTANIGVDYRFKGMPLTLGGNFNWTPETWVQVSASERAFNGVKRQADLYGLWKFSANTQLRLSANNLAEDDYLGGRFVGIGGATPRLATSRSNTRTYTTWGVRLEVKL
jgi:iron complex outermembrane receptor protein